MWCHMLCLCIVCVSHWTVGGQGHAHIMHSVSCILIIVWNVHVSHGIVECSCHSTTINVHVSTLFMCYVCVSLNYFHYLSKIVGHVCFNGWILCGVFVIGLRSMLVWVVRSMCHAGVTVCVCYPLYVVFVTVIEPVAAQVRLIVCTENGFSLPKVFADFTIEEIEILLSRQQVVSCWLHFILRHFVM